ncbi:MAG: hypothetical protein SNJ84_08315 [Verrucomicrobiia bacterium]
MAETQGGEFDLIDNKRLALFDKNCGESLHEKRGGDMGEWNGIPWAFFI